MMNTKLAQWTVLRILILMLVISVTFLSTQAQEGGTVAERIETARQSNSTSLDLSRFPLRDGIPEDVFTLTQLTHLNLSLTQSLTLPSEIGNLVNLKQLDLSSNDLETIPPEIGMLVNLRTLDLSRNEITTLPPEIDTLVNLEILDLGYNRIETLPSEIGKLINLKKLDLTLGRLDTFPPEIIQMTQLRILDLSATNIRNLPPEIGQLTNLRELLIGQPLFASVPPEIGQLTNLEVLELDSNGCWSTYCKSRLTNLPPELGQLTNLRELYIGGGAFNSLPREILDLENLETVSLYGGELNIPFYINSTEDQLKFAVNPMGHYLKIAGIMLLVLIGILLLMKWSRTVRHAVIGAVIGAVDSAVVCYGLLMIAATFIFPGAAGLLPGMIFIMCSPVVVVVSAVVTGLYWAKRNRSSHKPIGEKAKNS